MNDDFRWPAAVAGGTSVAIFIAVGTFFGFLTGFGGIMGTVGTVLCILVGGVIGGLWHTVSGGFSGGGNGGGGDGGG